MNVRTRKVFAGTAAVLFACSGAAFIADDANAATPRKRHVETVQRAPIRRPAPCAQATIPNVDGLRYAPAVATMNAAGFSKLRIQETKDGSGRVLVVGWQTPAAGTRFCKNAEVIVGFVEG